MFPLRRFTVREDSMLPTLKPGDNVIIFKFQKGSTGDLVVAEVKNKLIIKRVKSIEDRQYYLIGDNSRISTNSRHFGPIKKSSILGKVILISRSEK